MSIYLFFIELKGYQFLCFFHLPNFSKVLYLVITQDGINQKKKNPKELTFTFNLQINEKLHLKLIKVHV